MQNGDYMNKLIKRGNIVIGLLLGVMVLLAGCSSTKLSKAFDEQTVKDTAKEIVADSSKGDYESIWKMFSKEMQDALSADALTKNVQTNFANPGVFKKIKDIAVVGQKDKKTNTDQAVAVVVAEYENQNIAYTISFNTDMKVIGFYMK